MSSVSCLRAALTLWVNISDRRGQSALYWSMIKGQGEFLSEVVLPKEVTVTRYKSTSAVSCPWENWQRDSQHGQTLPPGQTHAWYSALGSLAERPPGKTLGSLFCSVTAASAPPLKPYFNLPLYVPLPPPLAVHIKHFLKNRQQLASGPISGSVTATPSPASLCLKSGWTILQNVVAVQFPHILRIRQKLMNVPIKSSRLWHTNNTQTLL